MEMGSGTKLKKNLASRTSGSLRSVSNLKICNFQTNLSNNVCTRSFIPCKVRCDRVESFCAIKGVHNSQKLTPKLVRCVSAEEIEVENANSEEFASTKEQIVPVSGSFKVESLLTTICDTTSIAEVELKIGGFRLHVKRDLVDNNISSPPPPTPIVEAPPTDTSHQKSDPNVSDSASSLALDKPEPASRGIRDILETAADEGLVILKSPKVGFFRTSRTIKGKRTPPSCKEKQEIKEGQVLCYVEQLGGEMPIESEVSGEVIKILRKDGEPIGYGDALIAILPSFPGIKKLQKTGN